MIEKLFNEQSISQNVQIVLNEVDKITNNIESLRANLKDLSIKIKIDAPQDITAKIDALNNTYTQLQSNLEGITTAQLRAAKAQTEAAKQAKLLAEAEAKRAKTSRGLQVTEQQVNAILGVEARTMAEAAEQNRILRAAAKQLDLTQQENIVTLKTYNEQINKNTEFIRTNSDAATQQKMNIGNYQSVWKGLNTSVQQIVREAPAAKYGMDVFFLAISNNIPMLMDAIQNLRAYNKQLEATGQAHKKLSVGKEILKSLISWQTLIMVGVTLLVNYGDEIINWISNLFNGKKALDATAIATEHLNEAWKEGNKSAVEETLRFQILTKAVSDNTLSMDKRKAALKELREQYPEHLKGLSDEQILTGQVGNAYEEIAKSIQKTAIAQAQFNQAVKLGEKVAEIQAENDILSGVNTIEEAEKKLEETRFAINELITKKGGGTIIAGLNIGVDETGKERVKLEKQKADLEKYIEALKKLTSFIDGSSLIEVEAEKAAKNKGNEAETYTEGTIGWWEQYISELEKKIKETKDTEVYNELLEKIQNARDVIAQIKGEKTEYEKTLDDLISKSEVQSMETQHLENLAKIEKDYQDQIALIENKGGELAEAEVKAQELLSKERARAIREENERYQKEIEKEARKIAKAYMDSLKNAIDEQRGNSNVLSLNMETEQIKEETNLLNSLNNKLIKEDEYQKQLTQIQTKYSIRRLEQLRDDLQAEINITEKKKTELLNKLSSTTNESERKGIEIALQSFNTDELQAELSNINAQIDNVKANANTPPDKEKWKEWAESIQSMLSDVFSKLKDIVDKYYENIFAQIENERESNEETSKEATANLEKQYEQGAISQEEYEARKRYQEELTAKKEEELRLKEIEAKQKQAQFNKVMSIAEAGINTASAVIQALNSPPPLSFVWAAMAAALGAAQIAVISSTPLPKYANGTDFHKGGLAVVGDGGKKEVVLTDDGAFITPDTPTVMNIPRGARVLPDIKLLNPDDVIWSQRPFIGGLSYDDNGEPIIINDYSRLEKEFRAVRGSIERQSKMMQRAERDRKRAEYKRRKFH